MSFNILFMLTDICASTSVYVNLSLGLKAI